MLLEKKLTRLKNIIRQMNSVLIAFSGGVDSAFLLFVASGVLPKGKILAVTASSETYPPEELVFSIKLARKIGVRHLVIKTNELKDKRFARNPLNRCYFCKKELFSCLRAIAKKNKLNFVVDASSISDKKDFRPGAIAKKELKVRSPLQEAGFTKDDIRRASKQLGLETHDKPSAACLASRIPYGTKISVGLLNKIDRAESYIHNLGFKQVRARSYDGLCRIEVDKKDIVRLISKRERIVARLKKLGYNYVTVDLEGFRSGSMNPAFPRKYWKKVFRKGGVNMHMEKKK